MNIPDTDKLLSLIKHKSLASIPSDMLDSFRAQVHDTLARFNFSEEVIGGLSRALVMMVLLSLVWLVIYVKNNKNATNGGHDEE